MADIEANALVDRRTLIKGAGAALVASALDFPAAHAESPIRSATPLSTNSKPCSRLGRLRRSIS